MDDTTFAVTYDRLPRPRQTAIDHATDRLASALMTVADYVVRGERCEPTDDGYAVTLLVHLMHVPPHVRTNLAFHTFFPDATVEAV